ncbi:MAG: VOC family protein, partial [Mycolicibacterium sp.]
VFWGGYSGYFADPDGHVWEVALNPEWTINDDGTLTI